MVRVEYKSNPSMYRSHYGSGLDVFRGTRGLPIHDYHQTGNGLGGILAGLARSVMPVLAPLLKRGAKVVGKQLLSSGVGIAKDLLSGGKLKSSLKTRGKEAAQNVLLKALSTQKKPTVKHKSTKAKLTRRRRKSKNTKVHQLSGDILG
jgi:hypothetical protein